MMFINDNFEERIITTNTSNSTSSTNKCLALRESFRIYSSKINWIVFLFICLFTLGSWLDIAGLWSELPLLCNELPEGWRLPSILTVISQFAQIGPFIFLIGRWFLPKQFTYVRTIYFIFAIGALSCLFLSLFWNKTVKIDNEDRSIYLYIFNFSLSLLDGMSTVTFLPYIGEFFSKEYIIPNYMGESLSSLLPGVLAMIQGIDETESSACNTLNINNTISNSTRYTNLSNQGPKFSVSVYFILMLVILMVSMIAFSALNFTKVARNARKSEMNQMILTELESNPESSSQTHEQTVSQLPGTNNNEINVLLVITFLGSFINYGYLPGLLSYSTLPYGNRVFHLSINLSNILMPIAILASIWSYKVSVGRIIIEFLVAVIFSIYILIISIMSPCPVLADNDFGRFLIIVSWIITGCVFLRVRCVTAARLETYGHDVLLNYGFITIIGQILGGVLIFLLVNIWKVFEEKPKCASADYCLLT